MTRNLGVIRGVTVRSRSVVGNFVGSIETLFGGNITIFTELCEHARQEAYDLMVQHARLIVGRISNPEARTNFEAGLRSIECALESARRIGRSI